MNTKQKLQIGLLIDNHSIPLWAYKVVETINNSNYSEIVLLIRKVSPEVQKSNSLSKFWNNRKHFLFRLFTKYEQKKFKSNPNAFELKSLKTLLSCPEILVNSNVSELGEFFSTEDTQHIKNYSLDVIIRLGFGTLKGEILKSSRYGIWAYHHGDDRKFKGGPSGVWEMFNGSQETGVVLQILTDDEAKSKKIYETWYSNDELSVLRNKNVVYWKAKSILPRKLEELYQLGDAQFFEKQKKFSEPVFYSNKHYATPTNFEVIKGIFSLYWTACKRVINRKFYFDQWILLFKMEETEKKAYCFYQYQRMLPPKDRFWADPFVLQRNDHYYIFIEELLYSENRGKISVIEMDQDGNYSKPQVVLETDYHLSYPSLIEDAGELYMLPETKGNKTIELYKCVEFPLKWTLEKVLFQNIDALDSTIYKHDGKYWLFTLVEKYNDIITGHELFLFYSDNLLDNSWISHPQNPIVSDHSFARPAGHLFVEDGRLFRPAQNCSKHYGYGMQIREIVTMNENEYEEKQIQSIYPNWDNDLISTHTLNSSGRLSIIDAKIMRKK